MDRNLDHLYPAFRSKVETVLEGLKDWCTKHAPDLVPTVIETYRPQSRQNALYAKGRTAPGPKVTQTLRSRHTEGLAVDICPFRNKQPVWDHKQFWAYYGHLCRANGIVWGGDWNSDGIEDKFADSPHSEWPAKDDSTRAAARAWIKGQSWK